jgi:small GTP-binding protein
MEPNQHNPHSIKILLLGDQAVGKTSVLSRYCLNEFKLTTMGTAGVDLQKKIVNIEGENLKVMIYDTAGHERFRSIAKTQYKGSKGIILLYDVTDKKTYDSVSYWMNNIKEDADSGVEVILVGNKIDLDQDRKISYEMGAELAGKYGVPFVETSAKSGENVEEAFKKIITNIYNKEKAKENTNTLENIDKRKPDKKTKSKCC